MFREDFDWNNRFDLKTRVGNYMVSTVDLGVNHSFDETPLYYETMVFKIENEEINFHELFCERYTTEKQARKGHKIVVEYLENLTKQKEH